MPVLEHVFAAIFNFVAFPQQYAAIEPTSKHHQEENKRNSPARPLPGVQRRNSNNIGGGKRASKMETVKRRSRVFSMSLPVPPLVPGGPSNPTPPHRQTNSDGQRDKPNPEPSTSSSSSITNSTIQSGSTSHSHSKGKDTTKGWANWSHDTDVVGSISTEELTKLVATGTGPPPTTTTRTQGEQKKKGVKRKRSDSSVASISSSFAPLSKKISGLMAKAPKKAKIMGSGLSQATSAPTNSEPMQVQEPSIINACTDIHAALRQNGCRLVGSSVDVDDLYTDRPDDAILSTMSIVRIFTGEQQQLPPSYRKPNRLTIETLTYCLWVACHKSLIVFPYAEDKEEEAVKEERECYAIQLFMAELGMSILERLPQHGVLHVPVDPRVSNDVVDIIHHTLYLLGAFSEAGATPTDLYRLVFDIPATTAGIHAGQILSLQHKLRINYTLVSDLVQAAACLPSKPYGLSVPARLMKNVADERIRSNMSNGPLFTGMSLLPGIKPPIPPLLAASRGKFITLGDQDLQEHPAFETIRAIARLVEIHAPGTVVSARDVDLRRFLHALTGVHAVSLTQDCLVLQRWHAYLAEGTPSQSLFHPLTEAQARRNEERARDVPYKNTPNTEAQEAAWETALRDEVEQHHARNPKIQRRYTDKEWISGSGLSKNVRDLAFMAGSSSNTTTPVSQPPEGFMTSLGGPSKRAVLMVMEGALEEECKSMGRLHALVGQYLERRFAPLRMRERAGTEEV